ncbi:MAG: hypothetical protein M5U12_13760 [Verrucomicrobia bacterium]|nr:hypothetical protein [Verrucomicrobiota bacterium]
MPWRGWRGFRGDASFSTWILRIATYAALKIIRKRHGLDLVSLDEATDATADGDGVPHPEYIADWRASPEQLVAHNETRQLIDAALAELDEKHRLVFLLRDVEGLRSRNRRGPRPDRGQCQGAPPPRPPPPPRAVDPGVW